MLQGILLGHRQRGHDFAAARLKAVSAHLVGSEVVVPGTQGGLWSFE